MSFIRARKLNHEFVRRDENGEVKEVVKAVIDVDLDVEEGQFIAILGHNGSGKYRSAYGGDPGAGQKQPGSSGNDRIQRPFPESSVRGTEAAGGDRGYCGNGTKMYYPG